MNTLKVVPETSHPTKNFIQFYSFYYSFCSGNLEISCKRKTIHKRKALLSKTKLHSKLRLLRLLLGLIIQTVIFNMFSKMLEIQVSAILKSMCSNSTNILISRTLMLSARDIWYQQLICHLILFLSNIQLILVRLSQWGAWGVAN